LMMSDRILTHSSPAHAGGQDPPQAIRRQGPVRSRNASARQVQWL